MNCDKWVGGDDALPFSPGGQARPLITCEWRVVKKSIIPRLASITGLAVLASTSIVGAPLAVAQPSEVPTDNLKLVESLDERGTCLFHSGVFPEGGAGYRDSSLPYENYEENDRAFQTLRAEALRLMPNLLTDVYVGSSGSTTIEVLGTLAAKDQGVSLESLSKADRDIADASRDLGSLGYSVKMRFADGTSLLDSCSIANAVHGQTSASGEIIPVTSVTDLESGKLLVESPEAFDRDVRSLTEKWSDQVLYRTADASVDYARHNDTSPFNGGGIANVGSKACTTGPRINGGSGMLTAAHCSTASVFSGSGAYMGYTTSSLRSANIDTQVIKGSNYSQRGWLGGHQGSSSLPAIGIYPAGSLNSGNQLLVSGARSGQGTVTYNYAYGGNTCVTSASGNTNCSILRFTANGYSGVPGDSGGPVAAYDPGNGRMIPVGIVQGGPQENWHISHYLLVTKMDVIAWLYGNASVG